MQTLQYKILIWSHYAALPKSAKFCVYNAMGDWTTMQGLINYAWGGWEN